MILKEQEIFALLSSIQLLVLCLNVYCIWCSYWPDNYFKWLSQGDSFVELGRFSFDVFSSIVLCSVYLSPEPSRCLVAIYLRYLFLKSFFPWSRVSIILTRNSFPFQNVLCVLCEAPILPSPCPYLQTGRCFWTESMGERL